MPGVPPELLQKIMSDPEVMALFADPEAAAKLSEVMSDPSKMATLATDPRFAKLFAKFGAPQ